MGIQSSASIVVDPEGLDCPLKAPLFRQVELEELRACYRGVISKPLHLWVYGPPGTGKTMCVRHVLEVEVPKAGASGIYVNARHRFTFLDMVEQILERTTQLPDPKRTRERQMALLKSALKSKRCVICIDEIETLRKSEMTDLLQHLLSVPTASLVCISETRWPMLQLSRAVQSRLVARQVVFQPYSPAELAAIVEVVAKQSLKPGACLPATLKRIGEVGRGDARRAMAVLRHAVERAEDAGSAVVRPEHLVPGNFDDYAPRIEDELSLLSAHHRILHDLVAARGPVASAKLEQAYREVARRQAVAPVSSRTINKYLNTLVLKRVLHRDHGAETGGWLYRLPSRVQAGAESEVRARE